MNSNYASLDQSATTESSAARRKVTPDFMRKLMGYYPDPADKLFKKHRDLLYKLMEIEARNKKMQVIYTVSDETVVDEEMLQKVLRRLVEWLQRNKFSVRPSSKAVRSFVVSWDPVETPTSITMEEKQDPDSVAVRRCQSVQREIAFNTLKSNKSQRDEDILGDLLAATPALNEQQQNGNAVASNFRSTVNFNRRNSLSLLNSTADRIPSHVMERTRQMTEHAASVAGNVSLQNTTKVDNLHSTGGGTTTTSSSDEQND